MLQLTRNDPIPGTNCLFLSMEQEAHGIVAVIYEKKDRTRSVRFLNEGDTEEVLRDAIKGPAAGSGETVTVDLGASSEEGAEVERFLDRYGLTFEDFLEGISEYFCRPGNRNRITGLIRAVAASLKKPEI